MQNEDTVRVWDVAVRLFHWSLVVCFAVAWLTGEEESLVHVYSGYGVLALVLFRILWGFIGTRHARFRDFIYPPGEVVRYLKGLVAGQPPRYLGHTPAGGWMILALLGSLLVTSLTGLKVYGLEGYGPLAEAPSFSIVAAARADGFDSDSDEEGEAGDQEELWEEIHEFFANLTLLLVFVHIAAVVVTSRLHRENLILAMITGRKSRGGSG